MRNKPRMCLRGLFLRSAATLIEPECEIDRFLDPDKSLVGRVTQSFLNSSQ
jgi:hypothetical protein